MMRYPCERFHGDFFTSWDRHRGVVVIRLDRTSVSELIADGHTDP